LDLVIEFSILIWHGWMQSIGSGNNNIPYLVC